MLQQVNLTLFCRFTKTYVTFKFNFKNIIVKNFIVKNNRNNSCEKKYKCQY